MKLACVAVLVIMLFLISPGFAEKPITKDSFVFHNESKADIKDKPLVTVNIVPYLSSGDKLDRTIHEKELPLDQAVTNIVEHVNNGVKKTKIIQIYPETVLEISDDAETIKQSSTNGGVIKHEIYYGYQNVSQHVPWRYYYKVENCDASACRVVTAGFDTRQVVVRTISLAQADAITGIPEYGALP